MELGTLMSRVQGLGILVHSKPMWIKASLGIEESKCM